MRNLKSILPMLAFVLAIGMSFAFVNATGEDYYEDGVVIIGGDPYTVDVNCNSQSQNECQVEIEGLGTFTVYHPDTLEALKSDGDIQTIPDPRL